MSKSKGKFQLPSSSSVISCIFSLSKQKPEESLDDDTQTQKDEWKKTLIDKLGNVHQREYLSHYGRGRKGKIRGEYCIYRVPDKLRQVKEDAYRPGVVSIGPLHQDNQNLAPMVQYKWSYLLSFLDQEISPDEEQARNCATTCLEECINAIHGLDEVIRQCYTEKITYTEYELAEIMLLDGCFILELFLRFDRNLNYMKQQDLNYDQKIKPHIITKCKAPDLVAALALNFFHPLSQKKFINEEPEGTGFKHLLDLLHKFYFHPPGHLSIPVGSISENEHRPGVLQKIVPCLVSKTKREQQTPRLPSHRQRNPASDEKWGFKYCASDLLESGIELQVGSSTQDYLLEISFKAGVVIIPQVRIYETTSSLLRNLIAYEQCSLSSMHSVTSYAFLLKSLIGSSRDINLLRTRKIIDQNIQMGDKEYLAQFESILDQVAMKDDYCFGDLFDQVNEYRMSWYSLSRLRVFFRVQFKRQKRILCTTYFSTTWKVISLMAGIFLLLLTSLQTYYTVKPRG
ncbi:hypothetical protein Pyn_33069 [Prunus yedoensis var. nudiflora]|uniref:Uncharacterized protein n=1 Tax=Prunus yedoensis var. nudiflora TaxID=2094558 RepID=A0A314V030_PRUYE|nr:hypothetical protein Pyn_33069 [Prunus yedoensis var. nudiflora]